jgi:hypothetical protein
LIPEVMQLQGGALPVTSAVLQSIYGAFDPDQSRTEDAMADEALANKEESREALAFTGRLVAIPLITGALISRAVTDPVLSFSLQVTGWGPGGGRGGEGGRSSVGLTP